MSKSSRRKSILYKMEERNIPIFAQIELTYKCNHKCVHCYVKPDPSKKEMSTEEVKGVLDELSEMGSLFVVFTGGEPFLRKDFFKILFHAREKNFAIIIYTNATAITPADIRWLKRINPFYVDISFLSVDKAALKSITGKRGALKRFTETVDLLQKAGIPLALKTPVIKENFDELYVLREWARRRNIFYNSQSPVIVPCDDGSDGPLRHRIDMEKIKDFIDFLYEEDRETFICGTTERSSYNPDGYVCSAGSTYINITAYGDIDPCIQHRLGKYNIRRDSIREVWATAPEFTKIKSMRRRDLAECLKCDSKEYCDLFCPALSRLEMGDLTKPVKYMCQIMHKRKEWFEGKSLARQKDV